MQDHHAFIGGNQGPWQVIGCRTVVGAPLDAVQRVKVVSGSVGGAAAPGSWVLRGFSSNVRYAERHELMQLRERQEGLDRPVASLAALIPIRKTQEWWALAQDERRAIFEAQSHHTRTGLAYLPEIARKLHHCRDLGEPFDFLTWFEFAPEHEARFERLLKQLRGTREWAYVDREVDIRLLRCRQQDC